MGLLVNLLTFAPSSLLGGALFSKSTDYMDILTFAGNNPSFCNSVERGLKEKQQDKPECVNIAFAIKNSNDCLGGNSGSDASVNPLINRCDTDPEFRGQNVEACRFEKLKKSGIAIGQGKVTGDAKVEAAK